MCVWRRNKSQSHLAVVSLTNIKQYIVPLSIRILYFWRLFVCFKALKKNSVRHAISSCKSFLQLQQESHDLFIFTSPFLSLSHAAYDILLGRRVNKTLFAVADNEMFRNVLAFFLLFQTCKHQPNTKCQPKEPGKIAARSPCRDHRG